MKKAIITALLLCSSVFLFAQHQGSTAIGVVAGSNIGFSDFGANIGFSYKNPALPIYWAAYLEFSDDYVSLGLTGDKYIVDKNIVHDENINLGWFLGLGAFSSLGSHSDTFYLSVGARAPIGLAWFINQKAELFLAAAPSLGIDLSPELYFPNFYVSGELGFRYWVN